jgi:hypothetical protein
MQLETTLETRFFGGVKIHFLWPEASFLDLRVVVMLLPETLPPLPSFSHHVVALIDIMPPQQPETGCFTPYLVGGTGFS